MRRSVCVVLHGVAPSTQAACDRVLTAVRAVADVPLTVLAVPRYHCERSTPAIAQWLGERIAEGHELALHGYTHLDDGTPHGLVDQLRRGHFTQDDGEFRDLSMAEAMRRITAGVRWFARMGLVPRGFVAPAWLMSLGTWEALRWMDMSYTCTLRRVVLMPERRAITSQALVYGTDSAWRRQASLAWNAALAVALRGNPLLRIELHPHDADHAAIRRSWQGLLEEALRDRKPCTLAGVADQFRVETDWDSLVSGLHFWDDEEARPALSHRPGAQAPAR